MLLSCSPGGVLVCTSSQRMTSSLCWQVKTIVEGTDCTVYTFEVSVVQYNV